MGPAVNIIIIEARLAGTLALAAAPAGPNRSRVFPLFPSEGRRAPARGGAGDAHTVTRSKNIQISALQSVPQHPSVIWERCRRRGAAGVAQL